MDPLEPSGPPVSETPAEAARHAAILHALPSLVWGTDAAGECCFVNQAWQDYTGRALVSERGRAWLDSVHQEDRVAVERAWNEALGLRRPLEVEYRLRRADGSYGWIHHGAAPTTDDFGRFSGYLGTCHDITEQRAAEVMALAREQQIRSAEQSARESEVRLRKFAEAAQAGIVFHEDGVITDCNEAIARLVGYGVRELIGSRVIDYVAPERREEALENVRRGYERPYESEIVARDGERIPVEFEGREMPFQDKVYRLSLVRDIRRRKASEARIDYLAHHDLLTGLPNRALLHDRLEFILGTARRRGTRAALLFIDLDNFKVVNDSLGHDAGDALLKIIAERIPRALRSADVVSRHGGDEFLVVLPDLDDDQDAVPVAEKLLAAITEPMDLEGQSVSVSPSIGISVFPRDGDSARDLIKNADAAMYLAKARGRSNYQFFNESLSQAAYRALTLETRIREALGERAFELHYQPQVRVADGAVTGLEALIRWPQADGGHIEPNEFIPVAEQRGLIRPLGSWVLRTACEQNRRWQVDGVPIVPVAVNLAANQFRQKGFVAEVERVLAETGLEPRYLAFELTESMLMEDVDEMQRSLEALRALGVKLAIDDFGTGHSSLMHLKRLPIDQLKIDRTFVRDTPDDPDDVAITAAIIDLARNMGITSIAEGVDRIEQLDFLRARGCEEAQGHLFARAMPAQSIPTWLGRPHSGTVTSVQA